MEESKTREIKLDESQQKVVDLEKGHFLVLASPGCGKTHILSERIKRAHQQGVSFDDMLCLTFTNRAAREMQKRNEQYIAEARKEAEEPPFIGNIHRFCSKFLFEEGGTAADTAVIDDEEAVSIIADFLSEDEDTVLTSPYRWKEYQRIIFLSHLIEQKEKGHPQSILIHPEVEEDLLKADNVRFARQYSKYKTDYHLLDFEDLLIYTYNIYKDKANGNKTGKCREYKWIQIDEVQDLNGIQLAIVDLMTDNDATPTVMYLGDEQQAIFSFMGAKLEMLDVLRKRCQGNILHLMRNHRSPQYLLDVFNDYAAETLHIDRGLLPTKETESAENQRAQGCLQIIHSNTLETEIFDVAELSLQLHQGAPEETIAVVVNANADAEHVSKAMMELSLPHFKVSGRDLFDTKEVKLLLAHLSVLSNERHFIAWARLLKGLKVFPSNPLARRFLRKLRQLAISPADLIRYPDSTYVAEFVHCYDQEEIVVFDTETTGTNPMTDDVIEIAAMRVKNGTLIGQPLDIYIHTEKEIPIRLGTKINPMASRYKLKKEHGELLDREMAIKEFLRYVGNSPVVGHNVMFDMQMISHSIDNEHQRNAWEERRCFDTLLLMRLLRPGLHSYKLESLLEKFQLTGENSHLAIDDVGATVSLLSFCHAEALTRLDEQKAFISHPHVRPYVNKLRASYGAFYLAATRRLYHSNTGNCHALVDELMKFGTFLEEDGFVEKGRLNRLHYLTDYLEKDVLTDENPHASLANQLSTYLMALTTMKEADFCNSRSLQEKVYVTTVHKAKGLEFDNVIVFDAVAGRYPNFYNRSKKHDEEDARKFYVAMSRARKRLFIAYSMESVDRYGGIHSRELTPFMNAIAKHFD